jgi:diguanylate cyclase (GGDEF)-like protein/PAS domain S-box-containing protein
MSSDREKRVNAVSSTAAEIGAQAADRLERSLGFFSSADEMQLACIQSLLASSQERVYFKDLDSRFLLVSAGWLKSVGRSSLAEVRGKTDLDIYSSEHAAQALADEQQIIRTGVPLVGKVEHETFDNKPASWVSTTKAPLRDASGRIVGTFGISRDVTAEVRARKTLAFQALHDPLTQLANRGALTDKLEQELAALAGRPGQIALMFVDLDDFKQVNDTLGHEAGDHVLVEIARRLKRIARRSDTVARLGGDEFVLLCARLHGPDDVRRLSNRVVTAIRKSLPDRQQLALTGSVGVAVTGDATTEPRELLNKADTAMYAAKRGGRNRFELYDERAHPGSSAGGGIVLELRRALTRHELFVVYQPLFRLDDGSITGVEALARWRHPKRGVILPAEFIPVAERHGLIAELDAYVLDEACQQLAAWTLGDPSWQGATLSVNLSGHQLHDPDVVSRVLAILRRHHIEPSRVCLEITETALIDDLDEAEHLLSSLSAHGLKLALDDFTNGYWTLAHLQQLRADSLKIDRSFVANVDHEDRDREIIAAITAMSHALSMTVVGEGIETDEVREELKTTGCDQGQGFLMARPLTAAQIAELWDTNQSQRGGCG